MTAGLAFEPLRQDLRLYDSGPARDGSPCWAIQDPVVNRFYRIGWLEYECLLRWPGDPERIAADIVANTPLVVDGAQIEAFGRFLERHQLLLPSAEGRERMAQQASQPGWRHWRWWLHHYLFIRVPLVRPQRVLERLARFAEPLFSAQALVLVFAATLLGLVLVARQWERFTHSVLDILTPGGVVGFVIALIVSKTLHELGHALVATRLGVRVAHMGVAFLVMWPMLYTDTGESWRLRSHRQRLAVSSAGIGIELALAGLSTLAWALLDDGALRQAALYLATTGWVLTVLLNASPFMRFDGYFILSDVLDFPNLHERAGAHARVWLRHHLLGLDDPWPEPFAARTRRALVAFAFSTWLYRLLLFLGIAWAVYAFFFKALGIFLMLVEITWFILKPIWSELSVWKKRWKQVSVGRRTRLWLVLLTSGVLLALPWRMDIVTTGVAHAERQQLVFAPFPARLVEIRTTGPVEEGAVLARFDTPDLAVRESQAWTAAGNLEQRLSGLIELREEGRKQELALTGRLREQQAEARAVSEERGRLHIPAGFSGIWLDTDFALKPGVWLSVHEPLGVLIDPSNWVVDAYVDQRLVDRIQIGAPASFLPEGALSALPAQVLEVDSTRAQRLLHPMLDSRHGGLYSTKWNGRDDVPGEALYRVRLHLLEPPTTLRELRGQVRIEGLPRSLIWEAARGTLAVLIRESGF